MVLVLSVIGPSIRAEDKVETDIYPYRVASTDNKNEMQIINTGIAALYARIDMIRRAKVSLELEYFIFNPDSSGRIVINELVKAVQRGVKVRILVDKSAAVFKLDKYYAKVLKDNGIEIRYYNPALIIQISSVQFRNHRKIIVRDGIEAITGGRNIADEYFNLSKTFNFLDRDIWIQGELVKVMKDSFELYWESDIVQIPSALKIPLDDKYSKDDEYYEYTLNTYNKKIKKAEELIHVSAEDNSNLEFALNYGKKALEETGKYSCPEASFATDREGAAFVERIYSKNYNQNYRLLRKEISEWFDKVQDEVILDSPYFLSDANSREVLDKLLNNKTKITILTNSLNSTDAIYVSTVFNDEVKRYTPYENFNAYIYKGSFSNESEVISDEVKNSEWGTHSKTIIFGNDSFMVGTFNIDNRSNFYNTEMGVFCSGSPELTNDILANIKLRMKNSLHLNKEGQPDDGSDILAGASFKKKMLYYMLKIPSNIIKFLL